MWEKLSMRKGHLGPDAQKLSAKISTFIVYQYVIKAKYVSSIGKWVIGAANCKVVYGINSSGQALKPLCNGNGMHLKPLLTFCNYLFLTCNIHKLSVVDLKGFLTVQTKNENLQGGYIL